MPVPFSKKYVQENAFKTTALYDYQVIILPSVKFNIFGNIHGYLKIFK